MQQLTYFVQQLYRSRDILLLSLELEVSHNSKINFFYSNFLFTLSFLLAFKNMVILKRLAPSSKGRGENTNTYRTSESQVPVVVALFPSEAWNANSPEKKSFVSLNVNYENLYVWWKIYFFTPHFSCASRMKQRLTKYSSINQSINQF